MHSSTPVQPVAPLFVFKTEIADTDHSIRFGGELDLGTEDQLREALAAVDLTASTPLRLHLSGSTSVTSTACVTSSPSPAPCVTPVGPSRSRAPAVSCAG